MKILIVDDDVMDRMNLQRAVEGLGIEAQFEEATDGWSGLTKLRHDTYDCAFVDYNMPLMSGKDLVKESARAGVQSPIVMLTAVDDLALATEVRRDGASDFLVKGKYSRDELRRAITSCVALLRLRQKTEPDQGSRGSMQKIIDRLNGSLERISTTDE